MKYIKYLTLIGKLAGVASAMDWTAVSPKYGVLIFLVSSLAKDFVNRIGDYLDDRQLNNSYKPQI